MADGTRPVVALVTDAIAPYHHGGKEERTFHVSRYLTEWADVHVYTMKWWDGPQRSIDMGNGVTAHAIAPLRPLYNGERRSITQAVIFALCCLRLLWRRFDHLEVDNIPVFPVFTARLVATVRRMPLVSTWHEVWGSQYWRDYLGGASGRLAGWLEMTAIKLPDHLVAASGFTALRLGPLVTSRQTVTVSRSGVDLDLVRSTPASPDASELCTVGRFLDHKRIDLLIDAVAWLREHGRDCRTTIVGSGPELDRLTKRAATVGVTDLVRFRSDLATPASLYAVLKASKVFVLPSEREGFGIAALEAMACGLPVITTSAPDNASQNLVSDAGFGQVCEPTAEAIGAAVLTTLDSDPSEPPTEWLDRYGWRSVAADLAEALQCA